MKKAIKIFLAVASFSEMSSVFAQLPPIGILLLKDGSGTDPICIDGYVINDCGR